jgi:hypothetical protein
MRRMLPARARFLLLPLAATVLGCSTSDDGSAEASGARWEERAGLSGVGHALAAFDDEVLVAATDGGLWSSSDGGLSWSGLEAAGLPRGRVIAMTAVGESTLAAYVWGYGLFGSDDGGASWRELGLLPLHPLVVGATGTRAPMVPFVIEVDPEEASHMVAAGPGGYLVTHDGGLSWRSLDVNGPTGKLNILFTGAAVEGDTLYATAQLPAGILPPFFSAILEGGVHVSEDGGESWRTLGEPFPSPAPSGVTVGPDGDVYVATQDAGLYRLTDLGGWESLGGPSDIVTLRAYEGGIAVGSGSLGPWRWDIEAETWSRAWVASDRMIPGEPTAAEGAVAALAGVHALMSNGACFELRLDPELPEGPVEPAGGTVHLAFSMHTNLYHSYRGNSDGEDGYGRDIRVIRNTLRWLDELPEVHADWDIENYFSMDGGEGYGYGWLKTDAPDILQRIRERREAGQDGIRLMSWNNGSVSWQTFEEFEQSVERAKASYLSAFGSFDPGVQPQENMYSPDHVGWYRQLGIEWITLFNSMTPFTGFPLDQRLEGEQAYNPVTLRDGEDTMTLVPVYHHADVIDRGSLAGWARQLSGQFEGDTLLVIHFDADSETWLSFDQEIRAAAELDFVRFTTIQSYLDTHQPVGTLELPGDLADGFGDGFQSWAEKQINQEVSTLVAQARELSDWARALAPGDDEVRSLVDQALVPRLLTLSTTNFGLAVPYLHPDREIDARRFAADSVQAAQAAFDAAALIAGDPAPGTIELVHPRGSSGTALVEIPLEVPAAAYEGTDALVIEEEGAELAAEVLPVDVGADPVVLRAHVVLSFSANETKTLTWRYDPANPRTVTGAVAEIEAPPLLPPFTECDGARAEGTRTGTQTGVDGSGVHRVERREYDLALCDGMGTVAVTLSRYDGHPGTVISVDADLGVASEPMLAESVALTPFACADDVSTIRWRSMGGVERSRPVRPGQQTWNPQSPDGWMSFECEDGNTIQIAHRVAERTTMGLVALRNDRGQAVFAPLGTLWGGPPFHEGRQIGGFGAGEIVSAFTGEHFQPSAPDWSGAQFQYRLLAGDLIEPGTLDLFAHPPLVRPGTYVAP